MIKYTDRDTLDNILHRYTYIETEVERGNELAVEVLNDINSLVQTAPLTQREEQIIYCLQLGYEQRQIAKLLTFNVTNYRRYIENILTKLIERAKVGCYHIDIKQDLQLQYAKCNTCKKEYPLTPNFYYKDRTRKSGFRSKCKACYQFEKERPRPYTELSQLDWGVMGRLCKKCGNIYPNTLDFFTESACRVCSSKTLQFITYIPTLIKCRECGAVKPRVREEQICRECHNKLFREYYNENKVTHLRTVKTWRRNHKEKVTAIQRNTYHRRRQREQSSKPLTLNEYKDTLKYFEFKCAYCGVSEDEHKQKYLERLHQDHIIPNSKCGGYTKSNIIPSCRSCNLSKGAQDMEDWYRNYEQYSPYRLSKIQRFRQNTS